MGAGQSAAVPGDLHFTKPSGLAPASAWSQATLTEEPASLPDDTTAAHWPARPVRVPSASARATHATAGPNALRRSTVPGLIHTDSLPISTHAQGSGPPERRFSLASVASAIGSPRSSTPYSPSVLSG
ncbi:hypothetical protein HDU82_000364, partial [Entophlyctis luteolus]